MSASTLDVRADFPFLGRTVNGKPIIYFDNAATTQKPKQTIERIVDVYSSGMANVHRAVNFLADEVTRAFEESRETVARFIGAETSEIVFVSNATHAINQVCNTLRRPLRVLTTTLEHHSNLLPWTQNGEVQFASWSADGLIDLEDFSRRLSPQLDLVAIHCASNFLGTIQPVREMIARSHDAGVPVLLDASQSIAHQPHDVRELDCEYMVFSGHKIYGPSGIGVLYIRRDVMEKMNPFFVGGSMVKEVHADRYVPNDLPYRFEAGTPNIEGAIGLAAGLDYVSHLGWDHITSHECQLVQYAKRCLEKVRWVTLYGPRVGEPCAPLISFNLKGLEATAVTKALASRANIIVRSGFLCAQPAHEELGVGPSVRASFAVYNSQTEVDRMAEVLTALTGFLD